MDCRTFRKKHVAFVDDVLPGVEVVEMQRHVLECATCAAHDSKVRRALLLFRNVPRIEPSPDFYERLSARLRADRQRPIHPLLAARGPGLGTFMGIAAGMVSIGFLAASSLDWTGPSSELALAPVVATQPAVPPPAVASQALVTSVSAGMPLWPMVYFAEQAPADFARVQFTQASWENGRD